MVIKTYLNRKYYTMNKALTDVDIKDYFGGKINVIKLSELKKYRSLEDLLGKYGRVVILIETEPNNGHYVCISKVNPKGKKPYYLFFDSYGIYPENELKWVQKKYQGKLGQHKNILIDFLLNRDRKDIPIHFSELKLQGSGKGISTCGRHCIVRLEYPDLSEYQYAELIGLNPEMDADHLVVELTKDKLGF